MYSLLWSIFALRPFGQENTHANNTDIHTHLNTYPPMKHTIEFTYLSYCLSFTLKCKLHEGENLFCFLIW